MSTYADRVALPNGGVAVPNGDGSYTVSGYTGADAIYNGVWVPGAESDPGSMNLPGYGWFVPQP